MKNRIHWHQHKRQWTCQTYKGCTQHSAILIEGEWRTEVNPNAKSNPRGHVVCDSSQVKAISDDEAQKYVVADKLEYDKHEMKFNIESGTGLLCLGENCYIIKKKMG